MPSGPSEEEPSPLTSWEPAAIDAWLTQLQVDVESRFRLADPDVSRAINVGLQRLRSSRTIDVRLQVPPEIAKGIRDGRLRLGKTPGVARDGRGRVVRMLEESRVGRGLARMKRVANVAVFVLDAVEQHVVDQKLAEILAGVRRIEIKVDSQDIARIRVGYDFLREVHGVTSEGDRAARLLKARELLRLAEHSRMDYARWLIGEAEKAVMHFTRPKRVMKSHRIVGSYASSRRIWWSSCENGAWWTWHTWGFA